MLTRESQQTSVPPLMSSVKGPSAGKRRRQMQPQQEQVNTSISARCLALLRHKHHARRWGNSRCLVPPRTFLATGSRRAKIKTSASQPAQPQAIQCSQPGTTCGAFATLGAKTSTLALQRCLTLLTRGALHFHP